MENKNIKRKTFSRKLRIKILKEKPFPGNGGMAQLASGGKVSRLVGYFTVYGFALFANSIIHGNVQSNKSKDKV